MSDESKGGISEVIFIPLVAFIVVIILWFTWRERLIAGLFAGSPYIFSILEYVPSPIISNEDKWEMAQLKPVLGYLNSKEYGFDTFTKILHLWGVGLRLLIVPCIGYLAFKTFPLSTKYRYRRDLDALTICLQNKELFPAIAPVIGKDLHKSDPFEGPWRIPDDYITFASTSGLLIYDNKPVRKTKRQQRALKLHKFRRLLPDHQYVTLDKNMTDTLFVNQLGKPWRGINALDNSLIRALAVSFMLKLVGGRDNSKLSQTLLDQLSKNFTEGRMKKNRFIPHTSDTSGVDELLATVEFHEDVQEVLNSHAFESTVLMGLLTACRKKGKLPPNQFRWLRVVDRTLWYTLHPLGGRKPWSEGAAAWVHYLSEEELGKSIATPCIEGATDGLEAELHKERWIRSPVLHAEEELVIAQDLELATKFDIPNN
jgi:intracellular multiplication protein IcmP